MSNSPPTVNGLPSNNATC